MAIQDLTTTEIESLVGTRHGETGFEYPANGLQPYYQWLVRALHHLGEASFGDFQIRSEQTDAMIRVMPGRAAVDDVVLVGSGETIDLSSFNNDTVYVWLYDNAGVAAISFGADADGWPTTQHVKLAEVTLAAGIVAGVVDRRQETALAKATTLQVLHAYGIWAIDGDGANTNGGGIVGDIVLTEAAAAFAQVWDDSAAAYLQLDGSSAGAYTSNYQLFPDTAAVNDAAYFGHTVPFAELTLDVATGRAYSGDAVTWEYYNGTSWATLSLAQDNTDSTAQNGNRSFQRDGAIHFVPPGTGVTTTINGQNAYWIRARISAASVTTAATTNTKNHQLVQPANGRTMPFGGDITEIRILDGTTGTLHTTNDVTFLLVNFTTGRHSGELIFTQDKRQQVFTGLSLPVAKDDLCGVLVTQEDGTNEVVNGVLELSIEAF